MLSLQHSHDVHERIEVSQQLLESHLSKGHLCHRTFVVGSKGICQNAAKLRILDGS